MLDDETRQALDGVLRIAARHPNLFNQEAFEELAAVVGALAPGGRISVMVPDSPRSLRIYALSSGPALTFGFGASVPAVEPDWHTLFVEHRPIVCDDMRLGNPVERQAAGAGYLSYAAFPCRVTGPRPRSMCAPGEPPASSPRVVGILVVSCADAGEARQQPADVLQAIADAVGPAIERAVHLVREHRLAMILETSGDAMLAWDRQGRVTDANGAAAALAGRARHELIGMPIAELLDPPPEPGATTGFEGTRLSLVARGASGPYRVTVSATVTAVEHDALVAAHVLLRDLSQVVAAERNAAARLARIHELEEQHRTLLDNAPLIIFRLDPASASLVYLNRCAERLLGVPTEEALRTPHFLRAAHADPEGVAAFDAAVALAAEGATSLPYEARLRCREGETSRLGYAPERPPTITVRGSVYPLLAEGGLVIAVEGVLADVSVEHAARARLVQTDRLSTLGTLAAGVAHEINNPAAFILLGLDLLDRLLAGPGVTMDDGTARSAHETLREVRDSIRRIVDIARDLRLFAAAPAPDSGRRAVVDVNRTVESALSLTRGQILERAQIERHLDDVPPVIMDDGQLGQVVVNLLVNAGQAIPRSYAADQRISVSTSSDGRTVEIEVEDTGVGIPEENLERIWQPFFTTKGPDVGTGLGLSISREIVQRAGGTLLAESPVSMGTLSPLPGRALPSPSPGPHGARFIISLPAAGQSVAPPPPSPLPAGAPPAARVLIVEDEPALARALADEIGHTHGVLVAYSAEEALARLAEEPFDVILCDLRMQGMSGEAFYARVEKDHPDQAEGFVFMTGVGFGADVERFLATSGRFVLEKPFPASVALDAIARVLKRRALS